MGKREAAKKAVSHLSKLGPREGKQSNLGWYLGGLFIPAIIVYMLVATKNYSNFTEVAFFGIIMGILLGALAYLKSDDGFYRNLNANYLVLAILTGAVMTFISWGLSIQVFGNTDALLSINSIGYPFTQLSEVPVITTNSFGIVPTTSSVTTTFIWLAIGGLIMAATVEELFKLVFIAEGQKRWKNGLTLNRGVLFILLAGISLFVVWIVLNASNRFNLPIFAVISATAIAVICLICFKAIGKSVTIPGAVGYVGFPVAFWSCLHAISAYQSPVMIIPAAVNGVLLAVYLLRTRCLLGAIAAHWIYNSGILLITFITGTAGIPAGTPMVPPIFSASYYSNSTFILELFLLFPLIIWAVGFWLLPSLRGKNE